MGVDALEWWLDIDGLVEGRESAYVLKFCYFWWVGEDEVVPMVKIRRGFVVHFIAAWSWSFSRVGLCEVGRDDLGRFE